MPDVTPVSPKPSFFSRVKTFVVNVVTSIKNFILKYLPIAETVGSKVWSVIVAISAVVYAGAKAAASAIGTQYKTTGTPLDSLNKIDVQKSFAAAATSTGIYGFVMAVILILLHGSMFVSTFLLPNALVAAPVLFLFNLAINLVTRLNHGVDPLATVTPSSDTPPAS